MFRYTPQYFHTPV